jgi:hypothetical protein
MTYSHGGKQYVAVLRASAAGPASASRPVWTNPNDGLGAVGGYAA